MSFEAEMIIPEAGEDDLNQSAQAKTTFLRYSVTLAYRVDENMPSLGSLELIREVLEHITKQDAPKKLNFPHTAKTWRKSILKGRSTTGFISTDDQGGTALSNCAKTGLAGVRNPFCQKTCHARFYPR